MKAFCRFGLLLVVIFVGCGPQAQQPASPPPASKEASQAEAAKAHVQEYVDRVIGGDLTMKMKLLSIDGVDFGAIDSIEVTSAVPKFSEDGKKIENLFRVGLKVQGTHAIRGTPLEKKLEKLVVFQDGRWIIPGTEI